MRFEEVSRILESYGYFLKGSRGSHRLKRVYLARLVKLLSIEEGI